MSFAGIFTDKPYLEQFERVKRWHKRLGELSLHNAPPDQIVDFIYAFFINCYHLKDWLILSKVIPKDEVEKFVKSHIQLMVCRDICNGNKHFTLKSPSVGDFPIAREYTPFKTQFGNVNYVFLASNTNLEAFGLANKCLSLWEGFLKSKGLI